LVERFLYKRINVALLNAEVSSILPFCIENILFFEKYESIAVFKRQRIFLILSFVQNVLMLNKKKGVDFWK